MTYAERRAAILAELQRDPKRSDRAIGRLLHVDGKTVGAVRASVSAQDTQGDGGCPTDAPGRHTNSVPQPEPASSKVSSFTYSFTVSGEIRRELQEAADRSGRPLEGWIDSLLFPAMGLATGITYNRQ